MNKYMKMDAEVDVDRLISEYDDTFMPLPDIELEPHLLISKVRKHYMDYMIKILATNYETNHRLMNKNVYLPSAIWKCAKKLEMKAAQTCMVVQLYRNTIVSMINEVKVDTKRGRLYNKLYDSLHQEPQNEKRTQTVVTGDNCQCYCNDKKRRRKRSSSIQIPQKLEQSVFNSIEQSSLTQKIEKLTTMLQENNNKNDFIVRKIPVVTNMQIETQPEMVHPEVKEPDPPLIDPKIINIPAMTPRNSEIESDDLMLQLEKLFQDDHNDDDDLFTSTLIDENKTVPNGIQTILDPFAIANSTQDSVIENHAAKIKSLDERLATLTGLLVSNDHPPPVQQPQQQPLHQPLQQKVIQKKQKHTSKWHCEEYFLKKGLFELLYQIGDNNRKKLMRIKEMYRHLFGDDSDDEEGIMSPDESPEFTASCKARIDRWVMVILAPYYSKGRIQGKLLYKSVARHLIELIYKCKQYPSRHEVTSFVLDFLENRGMIRCEADFKEFKIENMHVPMY